MAEERKECEMYLKNTNNSYDDYTFIKVIEMLNHGIFNQQELVCKYIYNLTN